MESAAKGADRKDRGVPHTAAGGGWQLCRARDVPAVSELPGTLMATWGPSLPVSIVLIGAAQSP